MASLGSDCLTGKIQYTKEGAAEKAARFKDMGDAGVTSYVCHSCWCWHVGHRDARRRRSGQRARAR